MLFLQELNSPVTFPVEDIHSLIAVEKRVMNERRSRLPFLGLLHTIRRMLNIQIHYSFSASPPVALFKKDRHVALYFLCSSPAESLPCSQLANVLY